VLINYFRYSLQEFVNVSRDSLLEIAGRSWCSQEDFDQAVLEKALSRNTLIVPSLIGCDTFKCLHIKIINEKEKNVLYTLVHNMPSCFQKAASTCGKVKFFFGFEP
jgi:hypothetical protein